MQELIARQQALLQGQLLSMSVQEIRAVTRTQAKLGDGLATAESARDVELRLQGRTIQARVYRPRSAQGQTRLPVLVWYPGGGFVFGHLDDSDGICQLLADEAHSLVVSVAYRLAPEHPWPAAHDDAYGAFELIVRRAAEWGGDNDQLAVGGDSAGGHLAASVARRATAQRIGLALQLLYYPVVSCSMATQSYVDFADGYGLTAQDMEWFLDQYQVLLKPASGEFSLLGDPADSRLPPAHIITAECDVLRDEGEALVRRLVAAGVPATGMRFVGMPHGFLHMTTATRDGHRALCAGATALRSAWAGNPGGAG